MLLSNLDVIAQAPQGVARLRELILTLAVQGKLVPQDPKDEPASELLKKIRAEKDRLMVGGKIKKNKPQAEVTEEEKPFELPTGWEWVVFRTIGDWAIGSGFPKNIQGDSDSPYPFIKVSDMNLDGNEKFITHANNYIDTNNIKNFKINIHKPGTVVFPKIGGAIATNKRRILSKETAIDNNCLGISPNSSFSPEYLYLFLRSIDFTKYQVGTSVPALSQGTLEKIIFGLPPLAEQSRIIARVEELMRLCDALEEKGRLEHTQHQQLLQALLDSLTQNQSAQELAQNWQRLAQHFDLLIDRPEAVDALEQTILQLAVCGLLSKSSGMSDWKEVLLGDIAEFINGDRGANYPNKDEYVEEGIPFINTGHIDPDGKLSNSRMNRITRRKFESLRSGKIKFNDLVYCLRGATLGKTAIVEYREGAIASSLVIIRPKEVIRPDFLYLYLVSPEGRRHIFLHDNGSAQPNLAANSVKKYKILMPKLAEQSRIVARVTELRALCQQLRAKLNQARSTQAQLAQAMADSALQA